jgi:hypothetical protein
VALVAAAAASGSFFAACGVGLHPSSKPVAQNFVLHSRPRPSPVNTPTPAPPEAAVPVTATAGGQLYEFDAPSVGVHLSVVPTGVKNGAMDTPEGPPGSIFWREAFWLNSSAQPGSVGTATLAGHLDDIAGRPAAFWNIRQLHAGDIVTFTRLADGVVLRYRVSEVGIWTDTAAATPEMLHRLYGAAAGGVDDGVARVSMITCTGHWRGPALGYDHRFMAFAELIS